VEMHGGTVTARSDGRDCGAEFVVRLPLHAAVVPVPPAGASPVASSRAAGQASAANGMAATGAVLRVLVVDDNVDAADSLALVLDELGIERRVAHDGWEGLELAQAFRPHVALLDLGMPGLDGYALARRLRSDPRHAGMVLAAVTGWSGAEDQRASHEAGFDHHFAKPADMARLAAMLEAIRARRSAPLAPVGDAA